MAQLEMAISTKKGEILFTNFEEVLELVKAEAKKYEVLCFEEDKMQEAKKTRAYLNKVLNAINNQKKEIKKQYLKPYAELEEKFKKIMSVIEKAEDNIDIQIKNFEEKYKAEKKAEIYQIYSKFDCVVPIQKIWKESWLNKTTAIEKIEEELKEIVKAIEVDIQTIKDLGKTPRNIEELFEIYLGEDLDIARAIECFKTRKKVSQNLKKLLQEDEKYQEEKFRIRFEIEGTEEEIYSVSRFLKENEIHYRKLD